MSCIRHWGLFGMTRCLLGKSASVYGRDHQPEQFLSCCQKVHGPSKRASQTFRDSHRHFSTSAAILKWVDKLSSRDPNHEKKSVALTVREGKIFDELAQKDRDKKTFHAALATYEERHGVYRRGHVEFIYAALARMKQFRVHRDLDTYKQILELFPKGKMIPDTMWQIEMMHYPKQQQCCVDVLDQMELNGVTPDDAMGYQLLKIFGSKVHAFRKYRRMMYWMPKFKNANPYYVPYHLPHSDTDLAEMALRRMAVDLLNEVSVVQTTELDFTEEDTFIASAQSPDQRSLLAQHPVDTPLFVEGGFMTWLRYKSLIYFVLKADTTDRYHQHQIDQEKAKDDDMTFDWNFFESEEQPQQLMKKLSVHEQQEGTILAMCITGTASKDSLAAWIKILERTNPQLSQIPVVFSLRTPEDGVLAIQDRDNDQPDPALEEEANFYTAITSGS